MGTVIALEDSIAHSDEKYVGAKRILGKPTAKCFLCHMRQFVRKDRCIVCGGSLLRKPIRRKCSLESLMISRRIGARMRQLRVAKGITQNMLARSIGCPRTYLTKYEQGHNTPTITLVARVARGLGVDLADLMDETITVKDLAMRTIGFGGEDAELISILAELVPYLTESDKITIFRIVKSIKRGQLPFSDWMKIS